MAKTTVVDKTYYKLEVDTALNRFYGTIKQAWTENSSVPDLETDTATALGQLSADPTVVGDISVLTAKPNETCIEELNDRLAQLSPSKVATVVPIGGVPDWNIFIATFESLAAAEAYLDE